MSKINIENILKTFLNGVPELGIFSMGVYLMETIYNLPNHQEINKKIVLELADKLKNDSPAFFELAQNNFKPKDIKNSIRKNTKEFIRDFRDFDNVVIVGIEALILDILAKEMPHTHFSLIPHNERIDRERLISNFPDNVTLINLRDVTKLRGNKSALLSYAFFHEMYGNTFVYPVVLRAIGSDVRCLYMDIVGFGILKSYTIYPSEMTSISSVQHLFTKKYPLI